MRQHHLHRLWPGLRPRWRGLLLLLAAGAGILVVVPHLWAWYHLHAGENAMECYHSEEALDHLNDCLRVWPKDTRARLLAARAARRSDRMEEAAQHLEICQQQLGASEEVLLEWSLEHAAAGDLPSVESHLRSRLGLGKSFRPDGPLICEALVQGFLRLYRYRDAYVYVNHWLEREPDHVQAVLLRARTWRARQKLPDAAADYRRVLALDPQRGEARWELALCLVESHECGEALPLLQEVLRQRRDNPDVLLQVALCREGLGETAQALDVLDRVLNGHPDHGLALRERGRMVLEAGQPAESERWLRRSLALLPHDMHANSYLAEALSRQDKKAEAAAQQAKASQLKLWTARLHEISERDMSGRPYDPSLYCEIGILESRLGHPDRGFRWLQFALGQDPNAASVHAALAEFHDQQGDAAQAAQHRRLAQEASIQGMHDERRGD